MTSYCGYDHEPWISIKEMERLDQLSDFKNFMKESYRMKFADRKFCSNPSYILSKF